MKTLEITNIPGLNPDDKVVIKKMNWGEKLSITDAATTIEMVNNQERVTASVKETKLWTLIIGIVEAPFFKDIKNPQERYKILERFEDPTPCEYLFKEISNFNKSDLTPEIKKNSSL